MKNKDNNYTFRNQLGQERMYTLRAGADPESLACKLAEMSKIGWKVVYPK